MTSIHDACVSCNIVIITGYTLSELRLYKQLKDACDKQLSGLEGCLEDVQRQYQQCAARLAAAEQQLIIKHKIKPS